MMNPIRLVKDIFDDAALSDIRLQPFANDHLIRLGNNNPGGIYSQLITDTTNAYNGFYGILTDQATKEAISEGLTITTNNTKALVLGKLSNQRDLVAYKFGDTSATYQQFFPQGLTEYQNARLDVLPTILDRYLVAAIAHLTADFPNEVSDITTLVTNFKNARNAQLGLFSQTDTVRTGRRETRKVLTLQLTKNMLTLAIDFLEDTDRFDDYFDATMLPLSKDGGSDDGGGTEPPTGNPTLLSGSVIDDLSLQPLQGATVTLTNTEGSFSAQTDADGKYSFVIPELTATVTASLTASASGHLSQTRNVALEPAGNHIENFQLVAGAPIP